MIIYISALIFGAVQGATEFFPVSSSGHLLLLHRFLDLSSIDELAFDVTLHFATLLALIIYFRKKILSLIFCWLKSFKGEKSSDSTLAWILLAATIPAAAAGFFLDDFVSANLRSPLVVATALAIVACLFFIVERSSKKNLVLNDLSGKKGLMIGLAQALALIPGTSRSGITIIAGMFLGLKRSEAANFSFLLSIPMIAGAALKETPALLSGLTDSSQISVIIIGFISAFFCSLLAVKYFLVFIEKHSLRLFAWYRLALAVLIVYFFA